MYHLFFIHSPVHGHLGCFHVHSPVHGHLGCFHVHSPVHGHLGCFHVLAIVNSASVNEGVCVFFWTVVSSGYVPSNQKPTCTSQPGSQHPFYQRIKSYVFIVIFITLCFLYLYMLYLLVESGPSEDKTPCLDFLVFPVSQQSIIYCYC